jgi:hypothetical protein
MATAPEQGIMALPENQAMQAPQLSLMDSYDAMQQGLQTARPDASMELEEALAEIRPELDELTDEQLGQLIEAIQGLYGDPENYAKEVADLVKEGLLDADDLPPAYDEEFLAALLMVLVDVQRSRMATSGSAQPMPEAPMGMAPMGMMPPQGFARGGIAEAARIVANSGRRGDTMLAHITPSEARLLKSRGGSGTINPETGLPEFFFKKIFKAVKKHVKRLANVVKKVLKSPIGRILGTIALGMVLGPAVMTMFPSMAAVGGGLTAMGSAVTGALASGTAAALSGGDLKSVLTSAATGFLGAPGGPVGNFVGKYTSAVVGTNAAANAALTGAIVGTGTGLVSGQNLKDSIKSGLIEGAISGGTAFMSGAPKVDVDNAAATAARDAVENVNQRAGVDLDPDSAATRDAFLAKPREKGAATQPAGATPKYLLQPDGSAIDTFTGKAVSADQVKQLGLGPKPYLEVEPSGDIFAQKPGMSQSEFARQNLDAAKAQVIPQGQLANLNEPPTGIFAQNPGMSQADYARKLAKADAASFNSFQDLTSVDQARRDLSQQTMGLYDRGRAAPQVAAGTPDVAGSYRQVGVMDSLGEMGGGAKKFLTGDFSTGASQFAEGAGNLFAPGPSAEQRTAMIDKFLANNPNKTVSDAIKYVDTTQTPNMFRTYGPGVAAGIGALALTGGFEPKPPPETEFQNQMRQPIDLSGDPSRYYVQGLPGVQYDERGNITGSTPWSAPQTMNDIRVAGRTYRGYTPPMYMNQGGAVQGKSYISPSARSIDYGDPYAVKAPMPVVNRYYPLVSNTPAPKKRYAGQPRTPEEMRQDLEAGRYSQSRFVPRNTSVVPGKSLLPSPAPARMNVGGIAALTQGGYPRRNGQISGPGTEKSDSIPAMLSDGEFVMTAKAVRGAGGGSRREGAKRMYALMNQLERNAARG